MIRTQLHEWKRREIEEAEVINAVCTVSKFCVEENEREWTGF